IYQVFLNSDGCPTAAGRINKLETFNNIQFVIDRGLYFASGSKGSENDNSILVIANGTQSSRSISIGVSIVALHISYPAATLTSNAVEKHYSNINIIVFTAAYSIFKSYSVSF
ncbi:unnamed protein product, partial [Rotaria sp. Silwood2]